MVRRIFGPKMEDVVGGWRKLHNVLHNLCISTGFIRVVKSKTMRWAGHVTYMERRDGWKT
jgi:hypothetical protein